MCLPFMTKRVGLSPSKGCSKYLCCFVALLRDRASKHGVSKSRVGQQLIAKHAVIHWEATRERRVKTCPNASLGCVQNGLFSAIWGYSPPGGQGLILVNWAGLMQTDVTAQQSVGAQDANARHHETSNLHIGIKHVTKVVIFSDSSSVYGQGCHYYGIDNKVRGLSFHGNITGELTGACHSCKLLLLIKGAGRVLF